MSMSGDGKASIRKKKTLNNALVQLSTTQDSDASLKRLDPLTAFNFKSRPLKSSQASTRGEATASIDVNKTAPRVKDHRHSGNGRLWVDLFEPTTEAELAVHMKKVEDVRRWLHEAFSPSQTRKLAQYRRILVLTGPAGTGKSSTLRVLSREMGFNIVEWGATVDHMSDTIGGGHYESIAVKFESFLNRASSCQNIFNAKSTTKPHIILLEDLPNILHSDTQTQFQASLHAFVASPPSTPPSPLVIVVSDSGLRGESNDDIGPSNGRAREREKVIDIRTILSRELLGGPYTTEICFNPIAPTLMRKALQTIIKVHFPSSGYRTPSKDIVDIIVDSSNGDIRSAMMTLQFACLKKGKGKDNFSTLVLEAVTRREQSLFIFHLLGKIFYNKRKNDPIKESTSAKVKQRDKDVDATLPDPPELPAHLKEHTRRTSRVDPDTLYANSPIDSSLLSLYLHQNYIQFCDEIDHCDGVAQWLSWVDASGGEAWYQANPHRFHLLTLGTVHSLPTPIVRRSQKIYKPEFFDVLKKEMNAWDGVRDVRDWMDHCAMIDNGSDQNAGRWSKAHIAIELGGILKVRDAVLGAQPGAQLSAPSSHRSFSRLQFVKGDSGRRQMLDEGEGDVAAENEALELDHASAFSYKHDERGGWLEDDDVEEF